ncbi:MAG: ABC transporter substrate-binding protein, partial [Candidatus Taylorbacteria bacterium]|nr:ABC transporter substrate-binding protein [Candidatus Taylorbacteria bacterium]
MKKSIWWVVGIVIVIVIIIAVSRSGSVSNSGPIKIGWIGPLTGDASAVGQNAKAATEIAVDEINGAGGINGRTIDMIYEDGKCNGKDSTSAAQKLLNIDKVVMLYGGACSGETIAAASLAENAKIPELSYCSSAPSLTTAGDYIFRNYPSDAYQGSFSADYLFNKLGKKKVAVIYVQTDWGTGVKDVFVKSYKDLGGTITDEEGIAQNATDAKTLLTKVKASNPDAIYFLGYSNETITALKQMTQLGIKLPLFGGDAWGDSKIYKDAGASAEGIMFVVPKSDVGDAFKAKMKAKIAS